MSIIEVKGLTKDFKIKKRKPGFWGTLHSLVSNEYMIKTAVDDVSFNIEKGEIVGYIGPNGAGKSTTIKMLTGILVPSKGSVIVDGLEPHKDRLENAKKIGVVFGQRSQLWWDIPVIESLKLLKHMYKIPEERYRENLEMFIELLDMSNFIETPVRQLSLGQKMRAELCAAMLHDPEILFLDEPTIGLDVVAKANIRKFIQKINKVYKTTVIITTHDMSDIEQLCSRIILINNSKVMYDGNISTIKNNYGSIESISIEFNKQSDLLPININGVLSFESNGNNCLIKFDKNQTNSAEIIKKIMKEKSIIEFEVHSTNIDDVIRNMYLSEEMAN